MTPLLILSACPTREVAEKIARALVESGAAACAQISGPIDSIYRWKGQFERAQEVHLWAKSTQEAQNKAFQVIRQHHPFEVPEILSIPITSGLPDYLNWIQAETQRI